MTSTVRLARLADKNRAWPKLSPAMSTTITSPLNCTFGWRTACSRLTTLARNTFSTGHLDGSHFSAMMMTWRKPRKNKQIGQTIKISIAVTQQNKIAYCQFTIYLFRVKYFNKFGQFKLLLITFSPTRKIYTCRPAVSLSGNIHCICISSRNSNSSTGDTRNNSGQSPFICTYFNSCGIKNEWKLLNVLADIRPRSRILGYWKIFNLIYFSSRAVRFSDFICYVLQLYSPFEKLCPHHTFWPGGNEAKTRHPFVWISPLSRYL